MIQICIAKITGYGPWTLTLGSDREHVLQMLQATLYKNLQERFSEKNCLVFANRADEFFAVTNGLDVQEHEMIKKQTYDPRTKLSFSIGCADTPYGANIAAYEARKTAQSDGENDIVCGEACDGDSEATIMHFDVDNLTESQKNLSPKKISAFFMGGDNFMCLHTVYGAYLWSF